MSDGVVSLLSVLASAESALAKGSSAAPRTWPTGFDPLDVYLGGGLRAGELILLGGPQGLGTTTMALQVLGHVMQEGGRGLLFTFEHDEQTLLERFLSLEAAESVGQEGVPLRLVREAMINSDAATGSRDDRLSANGGGADALLA